MQRRHGNIAVSATEVNFMGIPFRGRVCMTSADTFSWVGSWYDSALFLRALDRETQG